MLFSKSRLGANIRDGYLTDHKMVTICINVSTVDMGKSYWKFNNTLLKDEHFVATVRQKIQEIINANDSNDISRVLLFETVLCVLRGCIIKLASNKKRQTNAEIDEIEAAIERLLNPRPAGGGKFCPPPGFSQIAGKRRRAAPPYLAYLIPHQFCIGEQNF